MRALLAVLISVFLFATVGFCQSATSSTTTAPAQTINKTSFSLSGKVLGYSGGGTPLIGADAVSQIDLGNKYFDLRNDNIFLSTQSSANLATFNLGGPRFDFPRLKSMSNLQFYAVGEVGTVTSALSTTLAESVGGGLDYFPPSTPSVAVNLFEIRWLHGKVPVSNTQVVNNGVAVFVGVSFQ